MLLVIVSSAVFLHEDFMLFKCCGKAACREQLGMEGRASDVLGKTAVIGFFNSCTSLLLGCSGDSLSFHRKASLVAMKYHEEWLKVVKCFLSALRHCRGFGVWFFWCKGILKRLENT